MDIIFQSRHTEVLERFRKHAAAKLAKVGKLDQRVIRVDVEISAERNPRQSDRKERVEITVTSRGPAIRAEAAAEDRFAALDMAVAKLESRLRRAADRRKGRHGAHSAVRLTDLPEPVLSAKWANAFVLSNCDTEHFREIVVNNFGTVVWQHRPGRFSRIDRENRSRRGTI